MATLVLTAVGTAIGGPIGGAIGALAGQAADALIFNPKGREGPRLADLQVQTSRYGERVPHIFGRMRVAGTVIWSTDLRETTSSGGGGKGQPSVTTYAYSASFAVALSARAIGGIGRIWADGNLLRGSAGDFKVPLGGFRVHPGRPGQAVDPLIAAAVGLDQAPAFRDLAYAVFEDLQLADFGNRIPSLTFETLADAAPVPISGLATALLDRPVAYIGAAEPLVAGYAADGGDCAAALAPLVEAHGLRWRFDGETIALVEAVATGRLLMAEATLRTADGRAAPVATSRCLPIEESPVRLSVRHFDPERDYQSGQQSAERGGPGRREEEIGLPALLSADAARSLADHILHRRLRGRRTCLRADGWAVLDLKIGDVLALDGERGSWIVEALEWEAMAVRLTLRSHAADGVVPIAGDAGQPVLQPDLPQGPTHLAMLELPPLDGTLADAPRIFAAATGANAGWRRAALFRYRPEIETAEPIGAVRTRAVLGASLSTLPDGGAWTIDARHHVDIALNNEADSLTGCDDDALARGLNLCALGPELLQFGEALALGSGHYRLSRLFRGRYGSDWACGLHEAGERFLLVDPTRLVAVPAAGTDLGQVIALRAAGLGDAVPAHADLAVDGRSVLPPSPVHGQAVEDGSGDLIVGWTRRSRLGWSWPDGTETPLGEEREAYALTVLAGEETLRATTSLVPQWTYEAGARTADLAATGGGAIRIAVRQIGTHGQSHPLIINVP